MRLSALARKIEQTPKKLTEFLEENDIQLDNGINTILNEDNIRLVYAHFEPEQLSDPIIEKEPEDGDGKNNLVEVDEQEDQPDIVENMEVDDNIDSSESQNDNKQEDDESVQLAKPKTGTIDDLEEGSVDDIDLIKVKKVKLEGIKVVGKIELPEKPKKEAKVPGETDEAATLEEKSVKKPRKNAKQFSRNRKKNKGQGGRKPLSYEEKLKEEEREKLKKRRRRENEAKRRKKQYYEKKIKPKTVQSSKQKKKKKNVVDQQTEVPNEAVVHKNPIKRLWAWLNGKYDKY